MDYKVLSSKYLVDGGIERITIDQAGGGYTSAPTVTITPAVGDDTGRGAEAVAFIEDGSVSRIVVMNPGKGYQQAPTVTITGGGGTAATAIAVLNDLVSQVNAYTTDGWVVVGSVVIAKIGGSTSYYQTITYTPQ